MPTPSPSLRPEWDAVWTHVAEAVSARSLCTRARVGAVVVDAANRVVAVGYNNPPAGFQHRDLPCTEWCRRSQSASLTANLTPLQLMQQATQRGRESLRAPLIDLELSRVQTDYSDCPSLHAETNALSVCDRRQREGGTVYVTSHVCHACAKLIANSGLTRVVVSTSAAADATHRQPERSYELLRSCGLVVDVELW